MSRGGRKWLGLTWIGGALIIAFLVVGGLRLLVGLIPYSAEERLVRRLPNFPAAECRDSAESRAALERLKVRLFRVLPGDERFDLHLHVIRDSSINAFAFLGGEIFINSGLLEEAHNADEVAGVLAHEISHVKNRDVLHGLAGQIVTALLFLQIGDISTLTKIFNQVASLKFTRAQEEAADRGAIERLQAAHISTQPLAQFFRRLESMQALAMLSDHPDSRARAEMADAAKVENAKPALSDADWVLLKTICSK